MDSKGGGGGGWRVACYSEGYKWWHLLPVTLALFFLYQPLLSDPSLAFALILSSEWNKRADVVAYI